MGFAAEIKEFLGAAKDSWKLMSDTELKEAQAKFTNVKAAAEQKEMDDPLNQKLKEAKLAHTQATTANIGKGAPLSEYQRWLMKQASQPPPEYGPAGIAQPPVQRPAIGAPAREDPDAIQGTGFRRGGLVRKFAVGGIVEDDDLEDDEVTSGVTSPAIGPPAPTGNAGYEIGAQARPRPAVSGVPLPRERPPNPVDDGLKYGATQIQQLPAIGNARTRGIRGYAQGAGAAPMDDMIQVYRKIDPKGEMGESERNLYALEAVHRFKMNQGDTEGAARAAFQMLQTYKTAATRYAALTKAAMDGGHVDEGIKMALKTYAQVPDGNEMKLYRGKDGRIGYEMKDKDGNPISGGIATPEEIGAAAMRLATPGGFENHLVQMSGGAKIGGRTVGAGAGAKKEEEEAGPGVPKPSAYREVKQEQVDKSVDDWNTAYKESPEFKKTGKELDAKELAATKNMLYHIRRSNDVTDDQGLRHIQTILTAPEPTKKGQAPPFRAFENKEDKTHTIRFPDGGEITVPSTQIGMFKTARQEALQQRAKEAAEQAAAAARPSGMAKAWEGTTEKASEIGKDLSERASAVVEANPELAARVGSAVGAGKRAVSDAADWLSKQAGGKYAWETDVVGPVNRAVGAAIPAIGSAVAAPAVPYEPTEDRPL